MKKAHYEHLKRLADQRVADAKSKLGIFSSFAVDETRELFWTRFNAGKRFATNQSKWDALFMGLRAMGRDESIVEYGLKVLANVLINFTLGVIGAVLSFIYFLWGVVSTFQPGPLVGGLFFFLASLSAVSFCVTWVLCLYFGVAGTAFVAAKLIASNMRIEGGGRQPHRRVRTD